MGSLIGFASAAARLTRRLLSLVVVLVAVALTVGLALVAFLPNLGARAMVVTSGSMEPTIPVGGLVVVEDVDTADIGAGDVITYRGYTGEGLTTHRVLERHVVKGRPHFRTQGDANDSPDPDLAPAEGVSGRVGVVVPHAGRALSELQRPAVQLLLLGLPSLGLFTAHACRLVRALRARQGAPRRRRRAAGAMVLVAVVAALGLSGEQTSTAARFGDHIAIDENTFATGTW